MGEGFRRKVGKAFRHHADAVYERQFKEKNLFSAQRETRRTLYRFRLTDSAATINAGLQVTLADEGRPALGVWCSNRRIGELDAPSSENLRREFAADAFSAKAVAAILEGQPSLSGYCQAAVEQSVPAPAKE